MRDCASTRASNPTVAYVLKGYPRRSELFIASEIWRLEQLGVRIRLYVLKPADEPAVHPVVRRVAASPSYLPATTSLSAERLLRWLRQNAGPFLPAVRRMFRRHPLRFARAAATAGAQSARARQGWRLRKIYVKEFLQAIELADRIEQAGDVHHLHAHFAHGTTTVTWLAATLCGRSFSFTGHAKDIYRPSLNPCGLLRRKMHAAAFVTTCTRANVRHLTQLAPAAAVHLVYHGLNADFAAALAGAEPRIAPTRYRVVSVGRLVPKKGFDVLVEAIADLRDRGLDLELAIAGEGGEDDPRIRRLIARRGLSDIVELIGPVSQTELVAQYRRASVFALACRVVDDGDRDGIPNVIVEAMAAGLPVVSTAVSGIPELVRGGENGLLVDPDDPAALADALWRIAKDAPLAEQLATAGQATVHDDFDGAVFARQLAGLFREETR